MSEERPDVLASVVGPDLVVRRGEAVRVVGPNGCGKTSLLRSLAGLDAPVRPGAVEVACGVELLWQDAQDGLVGLTVEGEFRMRRRVVPAGGVVAAAGVDLRGRDVATLSTGEARRVTVALAEAGDRPLLLLDEPAEGLDGEGRTRLRALVRRVRERGAVVFVDPDGALAAEATRTMVLGASVRRAPAGFGPPRPGRGRRLRVDACMATPGDRVLELPALDLGPGVHALRGPNGGGKTTLLRRLAGLGRWPAGPAGTPWLPPRARDLLTDGSVAECLAGAEAWVVDALVPEALRARHPWTLSGGEAQRVALASVLGRDAEVYLLDEPDAHLDGEGHGALVDVLDRRADRIVVVATHDDSLLAAAHSVTVVGGRS